jgi:hypothetical protein
MNQEDFNCSITANITPEEAIENISHVSDWWTTNFEGSSEKLNDVFTVHFGETFVTFKVFEAVANKKIMWLVIDCNLHWLKDKKEWKDTKMLWEVSGKNKSTQISFTHIGLVPEIECYDSCVKGWNFFVGESLLKLLSEHKGLPDTSKTNR